MLPPSVGQMAILRNHFYQDAARHSSPLCSTSRFGALRHAQRFKIYFLPSRRFARTEGRIDGSDVIAPLTMAIRRRRARGPGRAVPAIALLGACRYLSSPDYQLSD